MPAAQMNPKSVAFWLAASAISSLALPATSGDWNSTYFVSQAAQEVKPTIGSVNIAQSQLAFSTDRDFGAFVLGGTYSGDARQFSPGFPSYQSGEMANLRAGYDFGQGLGYISIGRHQSLNAAAQDDVDTFGIGFRVSLNRALQLTGEFLHYVPSESSPTQGRSPSQISIGAAFRF